MIGFRIFGCNVRLYFSFFVFNGLIFLIRSGGLVLAFYTVCAVHEAGHIIAVALCGGSVRSVELSGAGIRMNMRKGGTVPLRNSIFVLLAGPAANIAVFLIMKLTGCGGAFPLLNLLAACYNMLPYRSLDGGAVISHIISGTVCETTADAVLTAVKLLIIVFAGAAAYLCGSAALTLLIASSALFIGDIRR